jgi:Family of unknown function (DUF6519)
MKGDFSRDTFDSKKHYNRVLMQQGRVQADADWNEQQAITVYREETETRDVIGGCGAPVHDAGFGIATDGKKLTIGKGRFYVDGILCENDQADLDYFNQPDFPNPPNLVNLLNNARAPFGIVYLDVWRRHLTALDDDYIREKALGGPDTATRLKTIWQLRVLPVQGPDRKECARLEKERRTLQAKIDKLQSTPKKSAKPKTKAALKKNQAAAAELEKLRAELAMLEVRIAEVCGAVECITPFPEWDALVAPSSGMLNAHTTVPTTDDVCLIPPSAGYQRLENQLYRVEIHNGSASNQPTFKWSRDNGIVVTSITNISGQDVTVHDVGPDDVLGFANGQWVEVSDDGLELNGLPGELIQIQNVSAATKTITLQSAPTLVFKKEFYPKLRRWDGSAALTANTWLPLEGGIEVQFSNGTYKTGDYWLIPARTATGEIEWPPFETPNTNPVAQPPRGIQHHYCHLALLAFDGKKLSVRQDCRDIFYPLAASALHVTETSWQNDDLLPTKALQKGLQIWFDVMPDTLSLLGGGAPPTSPTVIVAGEMPLEGRTTGTTPDISFIFDTKIIVQSDSIIVQLLGDLKFLERFLLENLLRVRVTLKGHTIFSQRSTDIVYLDGQAFGKPGTRANRKTPRIDLNLPSGSGARASDFESWFYIGTEPVTKTPLQVTGVKLTPVQGAAFDVQPQPSSHQATAQIDLPLRQAQITFNRPPNPNSVNPDSVFVFTMDPATNTRVRVPASLPVLSSNIVTLTLLGNGVPTGTLEVAGGADIPTASVTAQDDGTALDGDYDNAPGGDFLLPFSQIAPG